jgi:hypothetical protein
VPSLLVLVVAEGFIGGACNLALTPILRFRLSNPISKYQNLLLTIALEREKESK